jgi:two-component system sensor histidine kinase KdpD
VSTEPRPDPDALLAATRRAGRGRLKLFLGAAPGVGKTCAMLKAAHERLSAGDDLLVGLVETHGRADTAALLDGLPVWPRRAVAAGGGRLDELDLDGLLARRPRLLLVDEYAHTNAAGSRHLKRHQDIEDLLAAGIDVWSTLNVQHLESLNDAVSRITGVRVRETVPDAALAAADEIELIDLPPESLLERLRAGKIYPPAEAEAALARYFQLGNLTALRDLALRAATEWVDADVDAWLRRNPSGETWPTHGRMLVCVGDDDRAQAVVRAAARIARQRQVPWIAVHVIDSRAAARSDARKDRIAGALRLAESLGGEALTIPGEQAADELLAFARGRNLTQILVGRPGEDGGPWRGSVARRLLRRGRGHDITWIDAATGDGGRRLAEPSDWLPARPDRRAVAETLGVLSATTALSLLLAQMLAVADLPMLYLVAVLLVGVRHGRAAAFAAALASFALVNFLFTEPRYTFQVQFGAHLVTLIVFIVIAMVAGQFAAQLRGQMEALRKTARRTANLNEFSRRLTRVRSLDEAADALVRHLAATLDTAAIVTLEAPVQRLRPDARAGVGSEYQFREAEVAAARWCHERGRHAGAWTATLPVSRWLFVPIGLGAQVFGVAGLDLQQRGRQLSSGQARLLDAIADQAAIAFERLRLGTEVEQRRVDQQTERVRSALLASVSHDLRTPLAAIMGSASTLAECAERIGPAERLELADNILDGARRLDRQVQNLLDMTRLSHGRIAASIGPVPIREALVDAVEAVRGSGVTIAVDGLDALPVDAIPADRTLLRSLLVNLIENAARHGGPNVRMTVDAARVGRQWRIALRDDGPGLPAARLARPFEPFAGVAERDHRQAGSGTGLGLSICAGIATLHGATLDLRNGPDGRGCQVVLHWPVLDAGEPSDER